MEANGPIQFWIISSDEPGRIEVPVDTSSDIIDIIRPLGDGIDAGDRLHRIRQAKADTFCESPVDVMDANHARSISMCTVSTIASARATPDDLRLPEVGRLTSIHGEDWTTNCSDGCPSGRSYDSLCTVSSAESLLDAYALIEDFDSLIKGSLSDIRVRRAYRGRQSLLQEFDIGGGPQAAPGVTEVDLKVFGFTFPGFRSGMRTEGESHDSERVVPKFPGLGIGMGDLRRRIARFMSSRPTRQGVNGPLEVPRDISNRDVLVEERRAPDDRAAVSSDPGRGEDFLVLIPE